MAVLLELQLDLPISVTFSDCVVPKYRQGELDQVSTIFATPGGRAFLPVTFSSQL